MMPGRYQSVFSKSLVILFCVSLISACGNSKQVVFKSSGVTQTFTEGKTAIPKEFENYVFPDATTSGSVAAEGDNQEQSEFLMLSSKSPVTSVSKWYREKLKSDGWKITSLQEQPKLISVTGRKDNTELNIMVTEDNNVTSISLSIAKQIDGVETDDNKSENYTPNKDTPPTD